MPINHFVLPALAPSFYNLGIIAGATLLTRRWGIHGVALGTVLGALLHLLIQLPALRGVDWRYTPHLGLRLEGVRNVARLMGPRVLGLAITQANFWVNINLGSRIGVEGVVSALKLGFSLMLLPQGVVGQAIATVLLPTLSAQAARQEQDALRATLGSAYRAVLYMTVPATVGMVLLSRPLTQMFFQRDAFDAQDAAMVAWALAWYTVGLVAHSLLEIVTRAFYALHDTATPGSRRRRGDGAERRAQLAAELGVRVGRVASTRRSLSTLDAFGRAGPGQLVGHHPGDAGPELAATRSSAAAQKRGRPGRCKSIRAHRSGPPPPGRSSSARR